MSDNQLITKSNVLIQQSVDELNRREQYLMAILLSEFKAANPKEIGRASCRERV